MTAGDNIERAKKLAVLVAEAVRPLVGVEARFFGFTDSVIYDAGNANDCDVVGLEAGGGNNDAAALLHAANVAAGSNKRAKVLVMIVLLDDGEPDIAVAKFGRMIADLARRSLAG